MSQVNNDDCEECAQLRSIMGVSKDEMVVKKNLSLTTTGKIILCAFGGSFVTLVGVTLPFLMPALRKVVLPFVPATDIQVSNVMKCLTSNSGKLIDLGSGDGRIVLAAGSHGFQATGIDLNPWLVWYSRFNALRNNLHHCTKFHRKNIWKTALDSYDVVVIFGVEQMMKQLEEKLDSELKAEGQVIACRFSLPNWKPVATIGSGVDTVWLYQKP